MYDDEDEAHLPPYSTRCYTISNRDLYPDINIYTQFGDLTPSQMLSLFSTFRKWPEYNESSFLASFENSMIKMATSTGESIEGITEDDDDDQPSNEQEDTSKSITQSASIGTSKNKKDE